MIKVGFLSIQGSVQEHMECLKRISGIKPLAVKTKEELLSVDALILPGGESTAIGKTLKEFNLSEAICELHYQKKPIWGTCAGMILLAREISGESTRHLSLMDIKVQRNAYGSQLASFCTNIVIPCVSNTPLPLVFIRAPYIEEAGDDVQILAKLNGKIIAARQDNILATSFHPELTDDLSFHQYFINMVPGTKVTKLL